MLLPLHPTGLEPPVYAGRSLNAETQEERSCQPKNHRGSFRRKSDTILRKHSPIAWASVFSTSNAPTRTLLDPLGRSETSARQANRQETCGGANCVDAARRSRAAQRLQSNCRRIQASRYSERSPRAARIARQRARGATAPTDAKPAAEKSPYASLEQDLASLLSRAEDLGPQKSPGAVDRVGKSDAAQHSPLPSKSYRTRMTGPARPGGAFLCAPGACLTLRLIGHVLRALVQSMPERTERRQLELSADLLRAIDDFQFRPPNPQPNGCGSRTGGARWSRRQPRMTRPPTESPDRGAPTLGSYVEAKRSRRRGLVRLTMKH